LEAVSDLLSNLKISILMKIFNKIIIICLALAVLPGCGDLFELEENLDNPNAVGAENAELDLVMNNAMLRFVEFVDEASDETLPYVRLAAMTGGNRYDNQDSPASFDLIWFNGYAEVLPDLNLVIETADAGGFGLHSGAARIMKAYVMMTFVDLFGDVPFTQAFQGTDNFNPSTDSGAEVYAASLAMLDQAITDLSGEGLVSMANDLFYNNNVANWMSLANTLKLRYHLNTRLVNTDAAASINAILSAGNIIEGSTSDFQFQYGNNRSTPDARHPYYSDGYEDGGPTWYLSNNYMWLLFGEKDTEDPRLRYYFLRQDCNEFDEDAFTLDCNTKPYPSHWPSNLPFCTASGVSGDPDDLYQGYWGRDHGNDDGIPPDDLKRTAWGVYPAGGKFDNDFCSGVSNGGTDGLRGAGIQPIILSSFVYFMRAEAALTLGTSDDARTMLEMGVAESISKVMAFGAADADPAFMPDSTQVQDYVDEVLSLFDSGSDDDKLDVVMKEYFLALQGNGVEAYNGYRRTCKPSGLQPTLATDSGDFARSLWYPANSVNSNSSISQKAGVSQPVFWDTNATGCAQ